MDILSSLGTASRRDTAPIRLTGISLVIPPGASMETLVAQLQKHTDKHLYVVNGGQVHYCSDVSLVKPLTETRLHDVEVIPKHPEYYIYHEEECICCLTETLRNKLHEVPVLELPKDQLVPVSVKQSL